MTNSVLETIKARRATRKYLDKPVPKEIIEQILEAASFAPSGMNSQPWRFIVVTEASVRKELAVEGKKHSKAFIESLRVEFPERAKQLEERLLTIADPVFYGAPVIVFVITEGKFAESSAGLVAENMFLAAKALGVNSCWVGSGLNALKDPTLCSKLGLTGQEDVISPLIFGYADGEPEIPQRKPLEVKWI